MEVTVSSSEILVQYLLNVMHTRLEMVTAVLCSTLKYAVGMEVIVHLAIVKYPLNVVTSLGLLVMVTALLVRVQRIVAGTEEIAFLVIA